MRAVSPEGITLVKAFEGFSPSPYCCPAGYMTIGYGHVVRVGEAFPEPLNHAQAEDLLQQDLYSAQEAVLRLICVPLTDGQFAALVSFTFNLGAGALQRSTLRRKANRSEHEETAAEFAKWVWAGGKLLKGLIKRRNSEARLYCHEKLP